MLKYKKNFNSLHFKILIVINIYDTINYIINILLYMYIHVKDIMDYIINIYISYYNKIIILK